MHMMQSMEPVLSYYDIKNKINIKDKNLSYRKKCCIIKFVFHM